MPDDKPTPVVRDHRGQHSNQIPTPAPTDLSGANVRDHRGGDNGIKHVFVLMLENRSFDHMLGFSEISGTDAVTGKPTTINGLTGNETNTLATGVKIKVVADAPDRLSSGPGHGFTDALEQFCGKGAVYPRGGPYPPITMGGFAQSFADQHASADAGTPMACFFPSTLPILSALAKEFCVCDNWFSSMPGATEPNRMFVHAGTARNWDDSPSSSADVGSYLPTGGREFVHGTIFHKLDEAKVKYRIYADDGYPNVQTLAGISSYLSYEDFADDLMDPSFDASYIFIEPSYFGYGFLGVSGNVNAATHDFSDGNSQHPSGSVAAGERFIKETYEALRKSPLWPSSMFIITYDEHGGFYDHVKPPHVQRTSSDLGGQFGFAFDQLGGRVPAVVISPLIKANQIDHSLYDHTSILATIERQFNVGNLQERDQIMGDFRHLVTLATPRETPTTIVNHDHRTPQEPSNPPRPVPTNLDASIYGTGSLWPSILNSAAVQHVKAEPAQRAAIMARVAKIKTVGDLLAYLKETEVVLKPRRVAVRASILAASKAAHAAALVK
jgi:phospholipase C